MAMYRGATTGTRSRSRGTLQRRGGALVLAMITVLVVATLTAGVMGLNQAVSRRQDAATNTKLAFYMAEAGLAEAYAGLLVGKTGNVGTPAQPAAFGNGLFWVVATDNGDDTVELDSTGMAGNGEATLSLVAERGASSVAALGMFSTSAITVAPGALVDGYDSSKGSYESQVLGGLAPLGMGRLGSSGLIAATGTSELPTVINSEVTPGPEQTLATGEFVEHYGTVQPASAAAPLPPVEVPEVALAAGIRQRSPVPLLILPGTTGLEFLNVATSTEVIVQGPAQLVIGSLNLAPGSELTIDPSAGRVDIYLTRALDLQPGSTLVIQGEDPSLVSLQFAGEPASPLRLASETAFHGVIYAPEATFKVAASFEVFGALIGDTVTLEGAVQLHFDRNLAELSIESALPKLLSWRIVSLSASGASGASPFAMRGLDPDTLPSPSEAHADQMIHVEYWDLGGTPRSYDGLESGFDWDNVLDVGTLTRDGVKVTDLDDAKVPVARRGSRADQADRGGHGSPRHHARADRRLTDLAGRDRGRDAPGRAAELGPLPPDPAGQQPAAPARARDESCSALRA